MSGVSPNLRVVELKTVLAQLEQELAVATLSPARRKSIESDLRQILDELGSLVGKLDPIGEPVSIFDPSNPKVVGRFVSLALVAQMRRPLSEIPRTYGSGVYAIYYNGNYPLYAPLRGSETPIYVGQGAPSQSHARTAREQGPRLCSRLSDHQKNIGKATTTLDVADFEFRSLVVQSGWESAAEDYLIRLFRPIWNSETNLLYGLGKHGDAATTRANKRSPWDTLHPGRAWAADSIEDAKTVAQIKAELRTHFQAHHVFKSLDEVLESFINELSQI